MRLFKDVKGYANEKNAIRKLMNVLKCETLDELDNTAVWSVGFNGRFYPIVHSLHGHDIQPWAILANKGICIVG